MPDIHYNVAGQLRQMERHEMHDCWRCGAFVPAARSCTDRLRDRQASDALQRTGEERPAKMDTAPIDTVILPVTGADPPTAPSVPTAVTETASAPATEPTLETEEEREPTPQSTPRLKREASVAAEHGLPTRPKVERIVDVEDHIILHHSSIAGLPAGLRAREFTVNQVVGSETYMNQRRYLVQWGNSTVAKDFVIFRGDKTFVIIDGDAWEAADCSVLRLDERGIELYNVKWEDSFVPESLLGNAQEAIAEFERKQTEAADAQEVGGSVRGSIERTPFAYGRSPSPTAIRGRNASSEVDGAYDGQPHIPKLVISAPQPRADYAPGLRELIDRTMGADCLYLKKWQAQHDKRPLLFTREYTAKGLVFDMTRPERINAAFAQIAGERQWTPCECCEKGNGPFLGCVVATNFANGACANCACSWGSRRCNFHVNSTSERWMPMVELSPAPSRTASPQLSPSPELGTPLTPPVTQSFPSIFDASNDPGSTPPTSSNLTPQSSPNLAGSESELVEIANNSLPRRSKRLASSTFQPELEEDLASVINELESIAGKIPRLSYEASSNDDDDDDDTWVKIESTTYAVNWKPTSFRHLGCGGHENRPCQNRRLVPHIDSQSGTLRLRGRVMSDRVFESGEANEDEVRYIFSWCPCYFIESIHTAWQAHKDDADAAWTRESFASQHFTNELNEAVRRFCPRRQLPPQDQTIIELD